MTSTDEGSRHDGPPQLRRVDASASAWVRAATRPCQERAVVGTLLPGGYDAYVKVLHPFWLPRGMTLDAALARRHDDETVEELDEPGTTRAGPFEWARLTWRDLMGALRLPLTPEVDEDVVPDLPELRYPFVGVPDPATLRALGRVLTSFTSGGCLLRLGELGGADVMLEGTLADVVEHLTLGVSGDRVTWWSADRAWCVAAHEAAEFTLVAGSETLARALLACADLEGLRVELTTSLRSDARGRD
ncbi:hypothetical protein [Deinococcus pimensis]|uniref:hypothetical protein n=1 Tax=Deinococcus pimensis TaxID=309888 RepID=UPI000484DE6C|nr:hypothetical protein [Deinococcus pimensis]